MKKVICNILIFVVCFLLINIVYAQDVRFHFYADGATGYSDNIVLNGNLISLKKDNSYYALYDANQTINNINSINGEIFTLNKDNKQLTEWYTYDTNGKKHYYSENKSYLVSDIVKELKLGSDDLVIVDLYANWEKAEIPKTSLSLKVSNTKINVGDKVNVTAVFSGTKETVTWTSSDTSIATIDNNGKVTGKKAGDVTITAKTKSGLKSTIKIKVMNSSTKKYYTKIKYNMNGGKLANKHGDNISVGLFGIIKNKGKDLKSEVANNNVVNLYNLNNPERINVVKKGYYIDPTNAWNTKKDGTGKSFAQSRIYKTSDFCDSSKKDCEITLYVNWKKFNIKYNINGGKLDDKHGDKISVGFNGIIKKNGKALKSKVINYKNVNLYNIDNPENINVVKKGYYIDPTNAWNTKKDGTGKSFDQNKLYKTSAFCDSSKKDCKITLYANWKKKKYVPEEIKTEMKIVAIDYGKNGFGDSVLLESNGKYLLMDGSSLSSKNPDDNNVIKYLIDHGIKELDLYLSHYHADHYKGLLSILKSGVSSSDNEEQLPDDEEQLPDNEEQLPDDEDSLIIAENSAGNIEDLELSSLDDTILEIKFKINTIYLPKPNKDNKNKEIDIYNKIITAGKNNNKKVIIKELTTGSEFEFGYAKGKVLYHNMDRENPNSRSLLTLITCGKIKYLTAGDLMLKDEEIIINDTNIMKKLKEIDIMKLNHHANYSNGKEFLKKIKPRYVFYSYNHLAGAEKGGYKGYGESDNYFALNENVTINKTNEKYYSLSREAVKNANSSEVGANVYSTMYNGNVEFDIENDHIVSIKVQRHKKNIKVKYYYKNNNKNKLMFSTSFDINYPTDEPNSGDHNYKKLLFTLHDYTRNIKNFKYVKGYDKLKKLNRILVSKLKDKTIYKIYYE